MHKLMHQQPSRNAKPRLASGILILVASATDPSGAVGHIQSARS